MKPIFFLLSCLLPTISIAWVGPWAKTLYIQYNSRCCSFHCYYCILIMKILVQVPAQLDIYKNFNHHECKQKFFFENCVRPFNVNLFNVKRLSVSFSRKMTAEYNPVLPVVNYVAKNFLILQVFFFKSKQWKNYTPESGIISWCVFSKKKMVAWGLTAIPDYRVNKHRKK